MKSIIHLNYSSDRDDSTLSIENMPSLFVKEYIREQTPEPSFLSRAKSTLNKLKPTRWFDDIWDDISIEM
ncbi:hypothetical protein [Lacinutrix chionoecetis]